MTVYDPNLHPRLAEKFCMLGATDAQLADAFGVQRSTITSWKTQHEEFAHALATGKEVADTNVKRSLYERACGYSHPYDDIRTVRLPGKDAGDQIVITPTTKHYPPDTLACIYWLNNRCREEWRNVQPQERPTDGVGDAILQAIKQLPN